MGKIFLVFTISVLAFSLNAQDSNLRIDTILNIDFNSEFSVLRMVANQRVDMGIVDRYVADYLTKTKALNVDLGATHEKAFRPIRVHKNKRHILPMLNKAIARLQKHRKIKEIFALYGINDKNQL
mgnify:CR=1 FL=1